MTDKAGVVKIITVALTIVICLLLVSLIGNLVKLSNTNAAIADAQSRLAQLQQIERDNQDTIKYMQSDDFAERYAREYLNLTNPDDEVFVSE